MTSGTKASADKTQKTKTEAHGRDINEALSAGLSQSDTVERLSVKKGHSHVTCSVSAGRMARQMDGNAVIGQASMDFFDSWCVIGYNQ